MQGQQANQKSWAASTVMNLTGFAFIRIFAPHIPGVIQVVCARFAGLLCFLVSSFVASVELCSCISRLSGNEAAISSPSPAEEGVSYWRSCFHCSSKTFQLCMRTGLTFSAIDGVSCGQSILWRSCWLPVDGSSSAHLSNCLQVHNHFAPGFSRLHNLSKRPDFISSSALKDFLYIGTIACSDCKVYSAI